MVARGAVEVGMRWLTCINVTAVHLCYGYLHNIERMRVHCAWEIACDTQCLM